jgi:Sulfotransferase family
VGKAVQKIALAMSNSCVFSLLLLFFLLLLLNNRVAGIAKRQQPGGTSMNVFAHSSTSKPSSERNRVEFPSHLKRIRVAIRSNRTNQMDTMHYARHKFVFIGGLERSGTTLLMHMLGAHTSLSNYGALDLGNTNDPRKFEGKYSQRVLYNGAGETGRQMSLLDRVRSTEAHFPSAAQWLESKSAELFDAWAPHWNLSKPMLMEKSPEDMFQFRALQALLSPAYFVLVVRHPLATAMAQNKWVGERIDAVENWLFSYRMALEDCAWLQRFRVVHYEDLVRRPDALVGELHEWLGLERQPLPESALANVSVRKNRQYRARFVQLGVTIGDATAKAIASMGYSLGDWDSVAPMQCPPPLANDTRACAEIRRHAVRVAPLPQKEEEEEKEEEEVVRVADRSLRRREPPIARRPHRALRSRSRDVDPIVGQIDALLGGLDQLRADIERDGGGGGGGDDGDWQQGTWLMAPSRQPPRRQAARQQVPAWERDERWSHRRDGWNGQSAFQPRFQRMSRIGDGVDNVPKNHRRFRVWFDGSPPLDEPLPNDDDDGIDSDDAFDVGRRRHQEEERWDRSSAAAIRRRNDVRIRPSQRFGRSRPAAASRDTLWPSRDDENAWQRTNVGDWRANVDADHQRPKWLPPKANIESNDRRFRGAGWATTQWTRNDALKADEGRPGWATERVDRRRRQNDQDDNERSLWTRNDQDQDWAPRSKVRSKVQTRARRASVVRNDDDRRPEWKPKERDTEFQWPLSDDGDRSSKSAQTKMTTSGDNDGDERPKSAFAKHRDRWMAEYGNQWNDEQ